MVNKRLLALGLFAALGLCLVGSTAMAGVDIALDGYCDGLNLTNGPPVYGYATGCLTDIRIGDLAYMPFPVLSVVITATGNVYADPSVLYTWYIYPDSTWQIYATDGTTAFFVNSGTWHLGTPAPPRAEARVSALPNG
ncbi:MAG: hypothetical protein AB1486_29725 [Planctomycetota bacterium]